MARVFSTKKRNSQIRKPKPLVLIIAEGRNVTETLYFKQFQKQHANYNIRIIMPGSFTDPAGMHRKLEEYWDHKGLSAENGDLGFVVLDLDCNDDKGKLIEKLENNAKNTRFIVSNPCFEVWYLLHFRYSTHIFTNGNEVVRELKNHIAAYEKNMDVSEILEDKMDTALVNAERLTAYFEEMGYKWPSNECNPRTDVPVLIDTIRKLDK